MAEARYKNMWTFLIESNYEDAADIDSDMRCTICMRILINAHNSVCGCRYCLECVKAYLNGERRFCPGNTDDCKTEKLDIDSNIYPDIAINYRISKLIVACRYSCGFRCELKNMEEHERACQKQPVDCADVKMACRGTRLVTNKINEHLVGENETHTRLLMTCIDRLDSEIASMKGDTVELQSETAEMRRARKIDEARARETNEQVDQIKQEVEILRNENKFAKEIINSLETKIEKYRLLIFICLLIICGCVAMYLGLVRGTNKQVLEFQTVMQIFEQKIDLLVQKSNIFGQESQKEKEELRMSIAEVRVMQASELSDMKERVREVEIKVKMENPNEFVWPIEGWDAKKQSIRDETCDVIFSEPFYSHNNGYKMCLSVDPNGYGACKGTHLAVYFYIMRGPFDNILSWPFNRNVTLSIINQHTGLDYVSDTITFDDYPSSDWNKPLDDKNGGFGTDRLIELTALSSVPGLCLNDKIFIRCVVN